MIRQTLAILALAGALAAPGWAKTLDELRSDYDYLGDLYEMGWAERDRLEALLRAPDQVLLDAGGDLYAISRAQLLRVVPKLITLIQISGQDSLLLSRLPPKQRFMAGILLQSGMAADAAILKIDQNDRQIRQREENRLAEINLGLRDIEDLQNMLWDQIVVARDAATEMPTAEPVPAVPTPAPGASIGGWGVAVPEPDGGDGGGVTSRACNDPDIPADQHAWFASVAYGGSGPHLVKNGLICLWTQVIAIGGGVTQRYDCETNEPFACTLAGDPRAVDVYTNDEGNTVLRDKASGDRITLTAPN